VRTLLCSRESFNDMEDFGKTRHEWFDAFIDLKHGIPSHATFNRHLQPPLFRASTALIPGCFSNASCVGRRRGRSSPWTARHCGTRE
jgi:hypothetical protein